MGNPHSKLKLTPKRKSFRPRQWPIGHVFSRQRITTTKVASGEKSRKFVHPYSHFRFQISIATTPTSHISSMTSAAIAIYSLFLVGSNAFVPTSTSASAGVRRHRPSTTTPIPASSLVESSQFSSTTSINSSISPDQDEASSMFAPSEEANVSWVDLPNNKAQDRGQELADAFELYAGRVAMVASLGLLAGEFLNHKSITDQVLCALHIID